MLPRRRTRRNRSPFSLLNELENSLMRTSGDGGHQVRFLPAVEARQSEEAVEITAEVPGMSAEDLSVEVEDGQLVLSGQKRDEHTEEDEDNGVRRVMTERTYGAFERSFRLPRDVDAEDIQARYDNGVLTVRVPRTARSEGRQVQIES